jgi:hypothetical protein
MKTERVAVPKAWTADEITHLKMLVEQGLPISKIALRLARSYSAVIYKARREGIEFASIGGITPRRP